MNKEKFEVIIPARIYIVYSLEEVKKIMDEFKVQGISVRRIKNETNN